MLQEKRGCGLKGEQHRWKSDERRRIDGTSGLRKRMRMGMPIHNYDLKKRDKIMIA